MMHLPQELIEEIIDYLHDDVPTLKVCASVSPAWTNHSRIRLLRSGVILDLQDGTVQPPTYKNEISKQLISFHCLISANPPLAEHVHCLEIRGFMWRLPEEWNTLLTEVIQALRHVRQLTFRRVRWYFIPEPLQMEFRSILRLPTLVSIDFDEFATPDASTMLDLLTLPPMLRNFRVSDIRRTESALGTKFSFNHEQQSLPLDSLTILVGTNSAWIDILSSLYRGQNPPYSIKALRRLCLSHTWTIDPAQRLLEEVGPTLEIFEVVARPAIYSTFHPFTVYFHRLPRLRRLVVPETFLAPLTDPVFAFLKQAHPLEELHVTIIDLRVVSVNIFVKLDAVMAQPALRSFRRLQLHVFKSSWKESDADTLLACFPRLRSQGIAIDVIQGQPSLNLC